MKKIIYLTFLILVFILNEVPFSEEIVGNKIDIAQDESDEQQPPARIFRAFGLGIAGITNLDSDNMAYKGFIGAILVINPYVNGNVQFGITTDFTDALFADLSAGVDILLTDWFIAPYFGGGFGAGYARGAGENLFGLTFSASAGVLMFRTDLVQLEIETQVRFLLNSIENGVPLVYALTAGIYF